MNARQLWQKIFGDHRDQREALRQAGFSDEAEATRWALTLLPEGRTRISRGLLARRIRQARPDLTLATAVYITEQTKTRHF